MRNDRPSQKEIAEKMAFMQAALSGELPGEIYEDITLADGCVVRETYNGKTQRLETRLISKPQGYDERLQEIVRQAQDTHGKSGLRGLPRSFGGNMAPHSCIPEGLEHQFRGETGHWDADGEDCFDDPAFRRKFHAHFGDRLTLEGAK